MRKLRIGFAIFSGKTISRVLRFMGRGATTLPGRVALKLCPGLISEFIRKTDSCHNRDQRENNDDTYNDGDPQ